MSNIHTIRDPHSEMTLDQYTKVLILYLNELQQGRVKPNKDSRSNSAVVRDSWEHMGEIEAVKEKINQLLELDINSINKKKDEQKLKRTDYSR